MTEKLTLKQEAFITEYVKTGSATEAAIKAGYSIHTAGVIGYENLNKPYIRDAIKTVRESMAQDKALSVAERKAILADIAVNGNRKNTNPVEAIKEINRMEGSYPPQQHQIASRVIFEVHHVDRRQLSEPIESITSPLIEESNTKLLLEGEEDV